MFLNAAVRFCPTNPFAPVMRILKINASLNFL